MSYIDWEYYNSHFPTPVPQSKFNAVEVQAENEFNRIVKPYMLDSISNDKIQNCIFQLCNKLYTNDSLGAGKGVSTTNNSGFSAGYAVQTAAQAQEEIEEIVYSCIGTRMAGAF